MVSVKRMLLRTFRSFEGVSGGSSDGTKDGETGDKFEWGLVCN